MLAGIEIFLSFLVLNIFQKMNLPSFADVPNSRSMHSKPIKKSGGFFFFLIFWSFLFINILEENIFYSEYVFLFFSSLFFSILGLIDDLKNLSSKLKLIIELFFVSLILYIFPHKFSIFLFKFNSSLILDNIILTIFIVFITNLTNFMDGLDLYLSLTYIFFLLNFSFIGNYKSSTYTDIYIILLLAMSGFFYFNFPNAKMFMGDSGSLPIGFLISISPLDLEVERFSNDLISIFTLIPVFLLDGIYTIIKRGLNKENIFTAHRDHIYQRVQLILGWGKLKTTFIFSGLNIIILFNIILLKNYINYINIIIISIIIISLILFLIEYKILKFIHRKEVQY